MVVPYFERINKLHVFENKVLREIFGPNNDEVPSEELRMSHDEELRVLCRSPNFVGIVK